MEQCLLRDCFVLEVILKIEKLNCLVALNVFIGFQNVPILDVFFLIASKSITICDVIFKIEMQYFIHLSSV